MEMLGGSMMVKDREGSRDGPGAFEGSPGARRHEFGV